MSRAADKLEDLGDGVDLSEVAARLEAKSKQHYDDAHGKHFNQWKTEARDATRLRIAAEVLRDEIKEDRTQNE